MCSPVTLNQGQGDWLSYALQGHPTGYLCVEFHDTEANSSWVIGKQHENVDFFAIYKSTLWSWAKVKVIDYYMTLKVIPQASLVSSFMTLKQIDPE